MRYSGNLFRIMPIIIQVDLCYLQLKCFSMKMSRKIHWKLKSCTQMKNGRTSLDAHSPVHREIKLVSISSHLGANPHLHFVMLPAIYTCVGNLKAKTSSYNLPCIFPVLGQCQVQNVLSVRVVFSYFCTCVRLASRWTQPSLHDCDYPMDILARLALPFTGITVHLCFQY